MLNIYFDFDYIKTKKVFITKNIKHSKILNLFIMFSKYFKRPLYENLIFVGPHKRINNLIKSFYDEEVSMNKYKFNNTYIVNFDTKSEIILNELANNSNNKILVGPLFNLEFQKKLITYTNKFSNVKMLVASNQAYKNIVEELKFDVDPNNVLICPSGVISQKELDKNKNITERKDKCLIYFKNRSNKELKQITDFLESRNIIYEIFDYGSYKNKKLKKASKEYKFGIYLAGVESQGFAVQEMMACNLPLYAWDDLKYNTERLETYYQGKGLTGSSLTYWQEENGFVVYSYSEFINYFDEFLSKVSDFKPYKIIEEQLTFEVFKSNLINQFNKF
tara:strand:- start:406 stop:1407 length:1002 start_codon:yes stop_codon:yes gene_type:complete